MEGYICITANMTVSTMAKEQISCSKSTLFSRILSEEQVLLVASKKHEYSFSFSDDSRIK